VLSSACRAAIDVFSRSFSKEPVKGSQALSSLPESHAASATEDFFVWQITDYAHFVDILYVTHLSGREGSRGRGWWRAGWIFSRSVVMERGDRRRETEDRRQASGRREFQYDISFFEMLKEVRCSEARWLK